MAMSPGKKKAIAIAMIAVVGVVAAVGAYMVLRPTGLMTIKVGGEQADRLASAVGADGIAEENGGVFASVILYFDEARLKDANSGQWTTIKINNGHLDIVATANASGGSVHAEVLVQATVPQGTYSELVLVINKVEVKVHVGNIDVTAQVVVNNRELHLQGPITVDANGVILIVTIDITRSLAPQPVPGTYGFSPSATLAVEG